MAANILSVSYYRYISKLHHNALETSKFSKCGRQLISLLLHPRGYKHFLNIVVILLDQKKVTIISLL